MKAILLGESILPNNLNYKVMNEEEVRSKVLLPFLQDLGFDLSEISFEDRFTIRLGRSKTKLGKSDILIKRNGINLFVIELKSESVTITQDDIDQGISYARLLPDNIAPITIVSNGLTIRIFDSITREELTDSKISERSQYWKNGFTLSSEIDQKIRYEALKNFVSFSPENLKIFCEQQVNDRMGTIVGRIDNPYAKFVKELYFERVRLQNEFNNFLQSNHKVFGIVGEAGVGKTNAMCSLALQKLQNGFIFFYNAQFINKSPIELIAQDLNLVFSSKSESDTILKKLDTLGGHLNEDIIIFIDAIDENRDTHLELDLSEIALSLRNLSHIKMCVSCKSSVWNSVVKRNNNPTHLYEELHKYHSGNSKLPDNNPGFHLEDFNEEEMRSIIPLYKNAFGFKGEISYKLLNELKNGFFLRIFSEVYSNREIPSEINDTELIRKYLKQSLDSTPTGFDSGIRILSRIGEILVSHSFTVMEAHHKEGVSVESLLDRLNFSLSEKLPEDLFARTILIKSSKDNSETVAFYYSKIRDYVICYHSFKLDKLNDTEFYNVLDKFYINYIGESAISFYAEHANPAQRRIIARFKEDRCRAYVVHYQSYLDEHFKRFKKKFDPETEGEIGIFLPIDLLKADGYALFPMTSSSTERVQYVEVDKGFTSSPDDDKLFGKGVRRIFGSNTSLLASDQSVIVRKNIFGQLKEIIEKGRLNAYNSDVLLLELLSLIVYFYRKELGYKDQLKDSYLPRLNLLYPIDLKTLRDQLYKFIVSEHYKRKREFTKEVVAQMVEDAVRDNLEVPKLHISGDFPPFEELFKIVEMLITRGYTIISEHHFPCPDIPIHEVRTHDAGKRLEPHWIRVLQFSEVEAKLYIESFFKHFDSAYQDFVDYNFPTLKDRLSFYNTLPHEYFVYMKDSDVLKWGSLGYRQSQTGKVEVNFMELIPSDKIFERGETKVLRGFSLDHILHVDYNHTIPTVDKIRTPRVDDFCILRNWVYQFLKDDMRDIFKENGEFI
ncbi:MAG: type I restriction enzyme HsdR N-terminal domain-containing protein [Cyclobacteriaceae bacterium]|nr:type I restriction enzyme HsdR N-terminal domain-containing protein [Cyclobacteriaceae bacterium]